MICKGFFKNYFGDFLKKKRQKVQKRRKKEAKARKIEKKDAKRCTKFRLGAAGALTTPLPVRGPLGQAPRRL
jgi:hypothetical protein